MPSGENELEGVSVTSGNMNVAGLCLIFTIRTLCKVFALPVGGGFARFRFRYGGEEKSLALGHKRRAETWFTLCWLGWEIKVVRWQWICESCESCTVQNCTFFLGGGSIFVGRLDLFFNEYQRGLLSFKFSRRAWLGHQGATSSRAYGPQMRCLEQRVGLSTLWRRSGQPRQPVNPVSYQWYS